MTTDPEEFEPDPLRHPVDEGGDKGAGKSDLRFSAWNLLLLIPLLMLITVWYNKDSPRLFGMPFFYWFQFVYVFVGVACVAIVYVMTKNKGRPRADARTDENGARR